MPKAKPSEKYTAVVFVHGMGPQTRHANVGELLQALEDHCSEPEFGWLRNFEARTEPPRGQMSDDVAFMHFDRFELRNHSKTVDTRWRFQRRYRAYEAYWSPITAAGADPLTVAGWALKRLGRPAQVAAGNWRQYVPLRIARLHSLFSDWPDRTGGAPRYVYASLLAYIQRFRGHEGRRFAEETGRGGAWATDFAGFALRKIGAEWHGAAGAMLDGWRGAVLRIETLAAEARHQLVIVAWALALLLGAVVLEIGRTGGPQVGSLLILAVLLCVSVGAMIFGGRFLAFTFSDVFIWNSNRDHDPDFNRRRQVLDHTRRLIEHIARDDACTRLVIVAHSLGTAIALETLTEIGRRNEARTHPSDIIELNKLSHLITLGSPIDKIFYFFETHEANTYRAGRLKDDLRGGLSREPFFRNGKQRVAWLNIWDGSDPVSDPLYSPLGAATDGNRLLSADIINCEVENTRAWSAWASHVGYLQNEYVAGSIADALFHNRTTTPRNRPPTLPRLRDPAVGRAILFGLRWTAPSLLGAAALACLGMGLAGLLLALAPPAYVWVRHLFGKDAKARWETSQGRRRASVPSDDVLS